MDIKLRIKTNLFIFINFYLILTSCSSHLTLSNNHLDYKKNTFSLPEKELMYGINGHSVRVNRDKNISQYNQFSISEQVEFLKKLGVNIYRTDIYIDETGFFNGPDSPTKFEQLVKLSNANNIEVLPVISTYPWMKEYDDPKEPFFIGKDWDYAKLLNYIKNPSQNGNRYIKSLEMWNHYYNRSYTTGKKFAKQYGDDLTYYNTGNEIAYYISKKYPHPQNPIQNPTGEQSEEFFLKTFKGNEIMSFFSSEEHARRIIASVAYVSGLIDGIKSEDKVAKCIVSDGKTNFGFFKFLDFMGVDYDIVGWNWYIGNFNSNLSDYNYFNIYQELSNQFQDKPIWITETNRFAGSRNYSGESVYQAEINQANKINEYVTEFSSLDNIEAVIVYELIDQEYKFETRWEDYYGLITSPFPTKAFARLKPSFDTYRFTIEELKHANEDFAYLTLEKLYGNPPAEPEFLHWKSKLIEFNNKESFLNNVLAESENFIDWDPKKYKKEEINQIINPVFQQILGRNPTKREKRMSRRSLIKNPNLKKLQTQLLLSDEFWQNAIWTGYEKRTGFKRP